MNVVTEWFLWKALESELEQLGFGWPQLGTHVALAVLPLLLFAMFCWYQRDLFWRGFDSTRPSVRVAAFGIGAGWVFFMLATTPPAQPAGHGKIQGMVAVPQPNPSLQFLPETTPPPEKHEARRPKLQPPDAPKSYTSKIEEPLELPIDVAVRQLSIDAVPEYKAAPEIPLKTPPAPTSPTNIRIQQ